MGNVKDGQAVHSRNKAHIKNVMVKHLHSVYYCKVYILEYLVHTHIKVQNEELQNLIEEIIAVLKKHVGLLNQFYVELNTQPDNTFMSGIRSYTQEAMIVFLMHSKINYEKELIMLSYLDAICAINTAQIRMLDRMAKSLDMKHNPFRMFLEGNKVLNERIDKLAMSYLD
ncbi:MAG: hypothetical protein ACTHJ8_02810 [Mucilaginibacter sp.]|jgi:rubrerythrin